MLSAFKLSMGKKYLVAQEKNMFLLKEIEKEVVIEVTLFCVAIISDISVISHLSKIIQDLSTLYSEQVAKENRKTPNESMLTLFEQLLFEERIFTEFISGLQPAAIVCFAALAR